MSPELQAYLDGELAFDDLPLELRGRGLGLARGPLVRMGVFPGTTGLPSGWKMPSWLRWPSRLNPFRGRNAEQAWSVGSRVLGPYGSRLWPVASPRPRWRV